MREKGTDKYHLSKQAMIGGKNIDENEERHDIYTRLSHDRDSKELLNDMYRHNIPE